MSKYYIKYSIARYWVRPETKRGSREEEPLVAPPPSHGADPQLGLRVEMSYRQERKMEAQGNKTEGGKGEQK